MFTIKGMTVNAGRCFPAEISVENGLIARIEEIPAESGLPLIVPGFIDVHTHGGNRIDVNHVESYEDVNNLSLFFASHGVTGFLASVMTDELDIMDEKVRILTDAMERGLDGAELIGIHLEGPFLSVEYKGAMPESLLRDGDYALFEHFEEISHGNIRYITLAPEKPGMLDMIRKIKLNSKCVVSMGHSSAEYDEAIAAIDAGVTSSTHTFNAMKLFHMHRPAISGAALERDEVYTEMISDGFHLHPATVRLMLKTKGFDKVIGITDSIMAAGLPDGPYKLGVNDVVVRNGDAQLLNGVRAGSTLTMDRAFRNISKFTGKGPELVSRVLATNQAEMLGLNDRGRIAVGKRADLTVLDEDGFVLKTMTRGKVVYEKETR